MELTCWGATQTVTGSMHLLNVAGRTILLDCGLYQGRRAEAFERNSTLPFDVRDLDGVILTHAHLDHCGNLPNLIKAGYDGPIYCTPATHDLTMAMLRDAAHIQELDTEYINTRHRKKGEPADAVPLYTREDAERVCQQLIGWPLQRSMAIGKWVRFKFLNAGHILGSAVVLIQVEERNGLRQFCYSGDLGRERPRILRERDLVSDIDYLLIESTYGNRIHDSTTQMEDELAQIVVEAAENKSHVLIPAFAVDRTQEIVYLLHCLQEQGKIPAVPVYVDSPLAVDVTEVYRLHVDCLNSETRDLVFKNEDPFGLKHLHYVRQREDSIAINDVEGPCIIIAGSGMCEGGRIRHHLKRCIEDERHIIVIVSYQAVNTLGRRLSEGEYKVRIFGEEFTRRARVKILHGFSGHADAGELQRWVTSNGKLRASFVVHGDESQSLAFAERLRGQGTANVVVPERGKTFALVD